MNAVQLEGTVERINFFGKEKQWCGLTVVCHTDGSDKPQSIKMTIWSESVAASLIGAEKGTPVKITGYIENRKERATDTIPEHWELSVHVREVVLGKKSPAAQPKPVQQPKRQPEPEEYDDLPF